MTLAQGVQLVSFLVLSGMMLLAALGVVLLDNIVYSAFLLGGVFISLAGMYILLNADFVAAAQVLIYVGSVNVLILFAIMLVNKRERLVPVPRSGLRQVVTTLVCFGLLALLGTMIVTTPWAIQVAPHPSRSIVRIGQHFFNGFLLPFELASVLLLMALIGAVVLARRELIPPTEIPEVPPLSLPERPRPELPTPGGRSQR
ncbi:MAG: NADH-quinone oxidoreductase subunit J [Gloeomargarita sp. GMQP_bins_120]